VSGRVGEADIIAELPSDAVSLSAISSLTLPAFTAAVTTRTRSSSARSSLALPVLRRVLSLGLSSASSNHPEGREGKGGERENLRDKRRKRRTRESG
jgi:hypothetical protein